MGFKAIYVDSITSAASTSGGTNDFSTVGWNNIYVQVGTMSTAAAITIQNSIDNGTTYYNVFSTQGNTSTVANNLFTIASSVGTNGGVVPIPEGLTKIRFVATGTVTNGVLFKVICSN